MRPLDIEAYRRQGFVVAGPLLCSDEIAALGDAFAGLARGWAREVRMEPEDYLRGVMQWRDLREEHPAFAAHARHPRIAAAASALLGVGEVQVLFDYLIAKPPGREAEFPWHQDLPYLPVDRPRLLSCWLALDEVAADSGCLELMPGSHLDGAAPAVDPLAPERTWGERAASVARVPLAPGWAVFFDGLLWHRSGSNRTGRERRAAVTIYMDPESRFAPERALHPTINPRVVAAAGERFNEDRFPRVAPPG